MSHAASSAPSPRHSLEQDFMLPQDAALVAGFWRAMGLDMPLALAARLARFSASRLEAQAQWLGRMREARDPSDAWQLTADHLRSELQACSGETGRILSGRPAD